MRDGSRDRPAGLSWWNNAPLHDDLGRLADGAGVDFDHVNLQRGEKLGVLLFVAERATRRRKGNVSWGATRACCTGVRGAGCGNQRTPLTLAHPCCRPEAGWGGNGESEGKRNGSLKAHWSLGHPREKTCPRWPAIDTPICRRPCTSPP